jgi:hypothetical protein
MEISTENFGYVVMQVTIPGVIRVVCGTGPPKTIVAKVNE